MQASTESDYANGKQQNYPVVRTVVADGPGCGAQQHLAGGRGRRPRHLQPRRYAPPTFSNAQGINGSSWKPAAERG